MHSHHTLCCCSFFIKATRTGQAGLSNIWKFISQFQTMSIFWEWSIRRCWQFLGTLKHPSRLLLIWQEFNILGVIILIHWYVPIIEFMINVCQYSATAQSIWVNWINGSMLIVKQILLWLWISHISCRYYSLVTSSVSQLCGVGTLVHDSYKCV